MKNSICILVLVGFLSIPTFASTGVESCTASREYVTTLEYLRDHPSFKENEVMAQQIADEVSQGCTGAAQRFIKTLRTLEKCGLAGKDALEYARKQAKLTDADSKNFLTAVGYLFAKEYFDQDVQSAIRSAEELSLNFSGKPELALADFEKISNFCRQGAGRGMIRSQCSAVALRVARATEKFDGSVADGFLKAFDYLTSKEGPQMTTADAMKLAEGIVLIHPKAIDNFSQMYQYAVREKGLKMSREAGVDFAKKMAARTVRNSKPN